MDASGIIQSYDPRASSSAALTRAIAAPAPQYTPVNPFSGAPSHNLMAPQPQMQQNNPFHWGGPYTNNGIPQNFPINCIQPRPVHYLPQPSNDGLRNGSYSRNPRQGYVEGHHSQSPPIKTEPLWSLPPHSAPTNSPPTSSYTPKTNSKTIEAITPINNGTEINFGTEIDTLMKAIQAKSKSTQPQTPSPGDQSRPVVGSLTPPYRQPISHDQREASLKLTQNDFQEENRNGSTKGSKRRYQCTIGNCTKSFQQKTHLDIHERSHTGLKPYACKQPGCGRSFSQLGNLKTHERRHTGERPYHCDLCGKSFAQRGNVRAHKIVHDQAKPYTCQLDECGKMFSQLGNLKSHQNKFHVPTLRNLTQKFASIKDGDIVNAADKALWEYFAQLYKNSNKGIKGRGKDRKVGVPVPRGGNNGWGVQRYGVAGGGGGGGWSGSQRSASTRSGAESLVSAGSGYDEVDAPGDHEGYEDPRSAVQGNGGGGDLAFGDRMVGY